MQRYKLTKLRDDKFKGKHPNNINEGYIKEGILINGFPKEGDRLMIGSLITSTVTKEMDDDGIFLTKNSTYKLEKI